MKKHSRVSIGLIGCGAIGSSLARYIRNELLRDARLAGVYDIDMARAALLARESGGAKPVVARSLAQVCRECDVVIEAASSSAAWDVVRASAAAGCDCMIMSVGGIAGRGPQVAALARRSGMRVYVPSGAVCGIDGIKASRIAGIRAVSLTTRKHPRSFTGVPYVLAKGIDLAGMRADTVLFTGPASAAVKHFPQNINVAAVASLAGLGAARTMVTIIASPNSRRNAHELRVESSSGAIMTRTENEPHPDNPKTSYLAFLSAAAMLKDMVSPVKIGT